MLEAKGMVHLRSPWRLKREGWLSRWLEPERSRQHEDKVLLLLTLIIGAVVGVVVVAFIVVTENLGIRMDAAGGATWRRALIPVLGSLFTGYLLCRYFPDARGSGIPQTKAALFIRDGFISSCLATSRCFTCRPMSSCIRWSSFFMRCWA